MEAPVGSHQLSRTDFKSAIISIDLEGSEVELYDVFVETIMERKTCIPMRGVNSAEEFKRWTLTIELISMCNADQFCIIRMERADNDYTLQQNCRPLPMLRCLVKRALIFGFPSSLIALPRVHRLAATQAISSQDDTQHSNRSVDALQRRGDETDSLEYVVGAGAGTWCTHDSPSHHMGLAL